MTTTHDDSPFAPSANALTDLRAVVTNPPASIADAFKDADQQAQLLRSLLPHPVDQLIARLQKLIPIVHVTYKDDIPIAGISFWARKNWHIHVRASDPADAQTLTVLHELKHIIDHPLRRHSPELFSDGDWEALADHFAESVLTDQLSSVWTQKERRNTYE